MWFLHLWLCPTRAVINLFLFVNWFVRKSFLLVNLIHYLSHSSWLTFLVILSKLGPRAYVFTQPWLRLSGECLVNEKESTAFKLRSFRRRTQRMDFLWAAGANDVKRWRYKRLRWVEPLLDFLRLQSTWPDNLSASPFS